MQINKQGSFQRWQVQGSSKHHSCLREDRVSKDMAKPEEHIREISTEKLKKKQQAMVPVKKTTCTTSSSPSRLLCHQEGCSDQLIAAPYQLYRGTI